MSYYCSVCKKTISEEVYSYSKNNFNKVLYREHQPNQQNKKSKKYKPESTPEAKKLGELLKKYGHKVEFEKYDGYKHIDIAIVNKKVNIEVDGSHHNLDKEQALKDLKRTFYSWNKNYITLRIPNSLTKEDVIEETAEYIDKFLKADRNKLEKEIREEYIEEENPIWENANNFIDGVNNLLSDIGSAFSNFGKKLQLG